jgi:hypothetical protein
VFFAFPVYQIESLVKIIEFIPMAYETVQPQFTGILKYLQPIRRVRRIPASVNIYLFAQNLPVRFLVYSEVVRRVADKDYLTVRLDKPDATPERIGSTDRLYADIIMRANVFIVSPEHMDDPRTAVRKPRACQFSDSSVADNGRFIYAVISYVFYGVERNGGRFKQRRLLKCHIVGQLD